MNTQDHLNNIKKLRKEAKEVFDLRKVIPSKSGKLCVKCGGYTTSVIHQIECLKVKHIS